MMDNQLIVLDDSSKPNNSLVPRGWSEDRLAVVWKDPGMYPFGLATSGLSLDAAALWLAWVYYFERDIEAELTRPWLPVGRLGCLLLLGHCDPDGGYESILPLNVAQPVILSEEDYDRQLAALKMFVASGRYNYANIWDHFSKPKEFADLTKLETVKDACKYMYDHMVYHRSDSELLRALESRPMLNFSDVNPVYRTAAYRLMMKGCVIDVTGLRVEQKDAEMIPDRVRDTFGAVSVVGNVCWFTTAEIPTPALLDKIRNMLPEGVVANLVYKPSEHSFSEGSAKSESVDIGVSTAEKKEKARIRIDSRSIREFDPQQQGLKYGEFFHWCLYRAWEMKASDLHLERGDDVSSIRVRVDGEMRYLVESLPNDQCMRLINSAKADAGVTGSNYLPQDSAFFAMIDDDVLKVRTSSVPVHRGLGQSVVFRIQNNVRALELKSLELEYDVAEEIKEKIYKPHGMVILTGPTGSGKTTTLYSCIHELNTPDRKIVTFEDPIEIGMDGIVQVEINEKIGMTWVRGLEAMLRQDPDVALIGEIRSKETARAAVEASLTGHMVMATTHTNSAAASIMRLVNLGVDRDLLASALNLIVSQRLVQRLCHKCNTSRSPKAREIEKAKHYHVDLGSHVYDRSATGCSECRGTGTRGRQAAVEILPVNREMEDAIYGEATIRELESVNVKNGWKLLPQTLFEMVKNAEISFLEANKNIR